MNSPTLTFTHGEVMVELSDIHANPYQPRKTEDLQAVAELAESIERNGMMQTPTARVSPAQIPGRLDEGTSYQLAFGHSRLAAYKLLRDQGKEGYDVMPLIVRELTDLQMFEMAVAENIKRRDLSPMEEAEAIYTYMNTFNKTSAEAGEFFNKSPEAVRGAIRLVNLPEKAQSMLKSGEIDVSTARALLVADKLVDSQSVESILEEIGEGQNESPIEIIKDALRCGETRELNGLEWSRVDAAAFPVKHLRPLTLKDIERVVFSEDQSEKTAKLEVQFVDQMFSYVQAGMEVTYDAFSQVDVDAVERVRVLANPPACEKCAFHAALEGDRYCGFIPCSMRKAEAWEKGEAESISAKFGIPLYEKGDGPKTDLNVYDAGDKKLVKEAHPDLRLAPAKNVWNNFEGIGMKLRVVAIGELNAKRQKKQAAEKANEKPRAPERDWQLENRIHELEREFERRFSWNVAAPVLSTVFNGVTNLPALLALGEEWGFAFPGAKKKPTKKADALKQARQYLAYCVVYRNVHNDNPIKVGKGCAKIASEWGVKLPKDWDKQVEKFQEEFDAAKKELIGKRAKEKA
jgi:ParB/RepB/Spo0J family partition protein